MVCRQDSAGVKGCWQRLNLNDLIVTATLEGFHECRFEDRLWVFSAGSALIRCCVTVNALTLEQRFDLFVNQQRH